MSETAGETAADRARTAVIEVKDGGIRFRRNRLSRRSFKDLFAGASRRTRASEFWALRNITFDVAPGEVIGVVGRSVRPRSARLRQTLRP